MSRGSWKGENSKEVILESRVLESGSAGKAGQDPILSSNWWGYWSLEQPCSNTGASFHEPGDSQTQVSVTAKYFCPPTNTAGQFSLLQRCGNQFTHCSHILWWHQSTSQQISYCRVGKSFCWSSHLWLLSLWVAPVYLNSERLLRPMASQTGLELFKPCGKWLMEKVRGAQFSPPTRRKRNQSRSCLKKLLDLGNWKETA